ncbi:hypothetical protein DFH06DRAFT_1340280 [Mycena polygramma]|nr:hypothetical protein DFH06DRAFT_1340280 [Mycena polygramma]
MADMLASLDFDRLLLGVGDEDTFGRFLAHYVDPSGHPHHVSVIGHLLAISELDDGLKILILGSPSGDCPITSAIFQDQHSSLDKLICRDWNDSHRMVMNQQLWCYGVPGARAAFVYVRVSAATTTDVRDMSRQGTADGFAGFLSEVPHATGDVGPLDIGGLVACAVDMFRVDVPAPPLMGQSERVFERASFRLKRRWRRAVHSTRLDSNVYIRISILNARQTGEYRISCDVYGDDPMDSVSWSDQMDLLLLAGDSLQSRVIFANMSARRLFQTALVSDELFELVSGFLDFLRNHDLDEAELSSPGSYEFEEASVHSDSMSCIDDYVAAFAGFPDLPPEIGLEVVKDLALADRTRLAQTSHSSAAIVAEALQQQAVRLLAPFRLRFGHVRLMLTATGAAISGSAVAALTVPAPSFDPNDLDIVVGSGHGPEVVHFIGRAGGYRTIVETDEPSFAPSLGRTWLTENDEGKRIQVIESLTDNAFDVVGHFHLTCVYGAWYANGLLHCYPALTAGGDALTTARKMPWRHRLPERCGIWDVLDKYTSRGFDIGLNAYDADHVCGVDVNCPATLRTTDDTGCSYSAFPSWLYADDASPPAITCWTMGGTGYMNWRGKLMSLMSNPRPSVP